jgi:hypothetical protein
MNHSSLLPKKITIGTSVFKVVWMDKVHKDGRSGEFDQEKGQISMKINPEAAWPYVLDTLVHEALHGCEYASHLPHNEKWVSQITAAVIGLIRDNPALVKAIKMKDPE